MAREQWAQRTPEWYAVRRGLLTASDAAAALDIKPYASYRGSVRQEVLQRKVANEPMNNIFVAHGQRYEDEARAWAAIALGETVVDVGLVRHATLPWLAASPDGVTCSGKLMEIKCPLKRAIQPGTVPGHYWPQIQVQMEVCDVDQTVFVQYKPAGLQANKKAVIDVVVVGRDREWFRCHRDALKTFWDEYMAALETYTPPPRPEISGPACLVVDDMYDTEDPCGDPCGDPCEDPCGDPCEDPCGVRPGHPPPREPACNVVD
jgi:putative phage-type endonuclease